MAEPAAAGRLGFDVVERLLGTPPDTPSWGVADAANRKRALATWLSVAQARGETLTDADLEYLGRMRRRVADLHAVGNRLAAEYGMRVLKGPRIAEHYPAWLLRQSGDADLFAPDLDGLWNAALDLRSRHGATAQGISVLDDGRGGVHVGVSLKWPAEQPHLDKPMGADITSCAFCGDFKGVPVRVEPLRHEDLSGLFCVVEERFQRKYRLKDLLDFMVLAAALEDRLGDALASAVCATADELALAPELRELARKAGSWIPLSAGWEHTVESLGPVARGERARRRADRPGMHRLRFGLPLDERSGVGRELSILQSDGLDLAVTPLGTVLLLQDAELTDETWERAHAAARALANRPAYASA